MPKIMVSLAQRRRSRSASACAACARRVRRVCAAWRTIFYKKYDRIPQFKAF